MSCHVYKKHESNSNLEPNQFEETYVIHKQQKYKLNI